MIGVNKAGQPDLEGVALRTRGMIVGSTGPTYSIDIECEGRYECTSCTQSRVCKPKGNGTFEEVYRFDCIGNTPFCDFTTGSCTSVQSIQCALQDEFLCLSDGTFPVQNNCNKYYYCEHHHSYTFQCVSGVYDPRSGTCADGNVCAKFECKGKNGVRTAHPTAAEYFAYCADNQVAVVDKCDPEFIFSDELQNCVQDKLSYVFNQLQNHPLYCALS